MMKRLSALLVIAGILVAAYPVIRYAYAWYWQKRLFNSWEKAILQGNPAGNYLAEEAENEIAPALAEAYSALNEVLKKGIEGETELLQASETTGNIGGTYRTGNIEGDREESSNGPGESADETAVAELIQEEPQGTTAVNAAVFKNMLGVLEIKKIDARLPILDGTSADNLKIGAGKLEGSTPIGEIGNTVISAHRSHTYGWLFNRLNELEVGDKIVITTSDNTYNYTVFEIKVVEPSDNSVLVRNDRDRLLTLTTCDPLYIASHRLIIRAHIE